MMSAAQEAAPAAPLAARWPVARWLTGQRALFGTTMSLLGTTVITTVLGLAFWWVAARMLPLSQVGYGAAAVSALTLVGTFGMAGMNTVLIGYLARSPQHANGLLTAAMYASGLISALLASGFWLVAAVMLPRAAPYLHSGTEAVTFIAGSALTGATFILDQALLGTFGGSLQLWRNAAFAVAKLLALAGLALLWHDQFGTSILVAWVAGTALSLVPVGVLLRRRGMRLAARPQWRRLRGLGRASVSNTWLNNMLQAPVLAMPLLVTGTLSAADGGAFYVAWTVVMVAVLLPFHFTTALYAASAADPRGLAAKLRFSLRISVLAGLAGVPLVIACAHLLLQAVRRGVRDPGRGAARTAHHGLFRLGAEEPLHRAVPDLRADHASGDLRHRVDRRPARRRGCRGHGRRPGRPVNRAAGRHDRRGHRRHTDRVGGTERPDVPAGSKARARCGPVLGRIARCRRITPPPRQRTARNVDARGCAITCRPTAHPSRWRASSS